MANQFVFVSRWSTGVNNIAKFLETRAKFFASCQDEDGSSSLLDAVNLRRQHQSEIQAEQDHGRASTFMGHIICRVLAEHS